MQYSYEMKYNDFKREERSRNIQGSALKSICSFQESVTYIRESKFAIMQVCKLSHVSLS